MPYSRSNRHAREDNRAHVTRVGLDEKTRLSVLRRVVALCSHAAEIQVFQKVLTLSHQLPGTDVIGLSESPGILSQRAVTEVQTYSRHIFEALTFFPENCQ